MKKLWSLLIFVVVFMGLFLESCNYNYITFPEIEPPDTTVVYSFKDDVYGIFPASNCLNCHPASGGLDLTVDNAYASIMANDLVDTLDPESSKIWYYPNPTIGTHGNKYSPTDERVGFMLEWIKQGAKDN